MSWNTVYLYKQPAAVVAAGVADLVDVVTVLHGCMESPEGMLEVVEQAVADILELLSVEDTAELLGCGTVKEDQQNPRWAQRYRTFLAFPSFPFSACIC